MRRTMLVTALGLVAALAAPAQAAPPRPHSCTFAGSGAVSPADAGGLTPTGSIVTFQAEVVCTRDPLHTTAAEMTTTYTGHLTAYVAAPDGSAVCSAASPVGGVFNSVGPVLVMAHTATCVVPYTDPRRTQPLRLVALWATMPPYVCCAQRVVPISPVGVGT